MSDQFVAVAYGSAVAATSPDGITWTARTLPSSQFWSGVAWNGSVYCAVAGVTNVSATSPDGIAWTSRTMPSSSWWQAIAWNGSVFCAIAINSSAAATSPDGITWTARTLPSSSWWQAIAWNGSLFCAVSRDGGAATSPDGITWTARTMPSADAWHGVVWNGSIFCAVAGTASSAAATSPDGITWTARTLPSSQDWQPVVWNGSVFCTVAVGTAAATSPDGITWTARTLPSATWMSAAWNGSVFCTVDNSNTTKAATSPDGVTWTARTLSSVQQWAAIAGSVVPAPTPETGTSSSNLQTITGTGAGSSGNVSNQTLQSITGSGSGIVPNIGSSAKSLSAIVGTGSSFNTYPSVADSALTVTTDGSAIGTFSVVVDGSIVADGSCVNILYAFATAADIINIADQCAAPTIFFDSIDSASAITTGASGYLLFVVSAGSEITADTQAPVKAIYAVSAESVANLLTGTQFIIDFTDGWAYNLNTGAASFYEGFKFNSFAQIDGEYYGANDQGIYRLGDDKDAGTDIDAVVTLGTSRLESDFVKAVPTIYAGARSDEPMELTCRVEGQEYSYAFSRATASMAPSRVVPGKGLKGVYWQIEIANTAGADIDVDNLSIVVAPTSRKV